MSGRATDDLIHTSVYDALVNATYATPATIKRAIAIEKRGRKRVALIAGLERELRRRAKGGKRAGGGE